VNLKSYISLFKLFSYFCGSQCQAGRMAGLGGAIATVQWNELMQKSQMK
jgi:hypothetical protein